MPEIDTSAKELTENVFFEFTYRVKGLRRFSARIRLASFFLKIGQFFLPLKTIFIISCHEKKSLPLVIIESPFAGDSYNVYYARQCVKDSLRRGESPYASHLFFTQDGLLNDHIPAERNLGIEAGLAWGAKADKTVVYTDLGISTGMRIGIERAKESGRPIEYRRLYI